MYGNTYSTTYFAGEQVTASNGTTHGLVLWNEPSNEPTPVATGMSCIDPDYSAVQNEFVFVSADLATGKQNLFLLKNVAGSTSQLLTQTNSNHHNPRFSPDGNWVVFTEDLMDGTTEVCRVASTGGLQPETQLTGFQGSCQYPSISADGQTVLFVQNTIPAPGSAPSLSQLATVPLQGGAVSLLTNDGNMYADPGFGLNGNTILCSFAPSPTATVKTTTSYFSLGTFAIKTKVLTPLSVSGSLSSTSLRHARYLNATTQIVFEETNIAAYSPLTSPTASIWVVAATGGAPTQLSQGGGNEIDWIQSE